jgi:hypothetical protein
VERAQTRASQDQGNARFFANTQYAFSSLHTWGWITIIVGIIQLYAKPGVI